MSSLAILDSETGVGELVDDRLVKPVRDRLRQAREHRRQFEPTWALNLAYAAGDHWSVWDPTQRTLRRIQDVDARYRNRELYSVDVITEYRTTALGELATEDDRPQILTAAESEAAEAVRDQLNRALAYAWDHEIGADTILAEVDRLTVDLGTSAVMCRWDGASGPVAMENVPHQDGKPILDINAAVQAVATAQAQGQTLDFQDLNEGRCCWDPISALGLLVPPGITHEDRFPWEGTVQATYLQDVKDMYGDLAADLKADGDIMSDLGMVTQGASAQTLMANADKGGRLKDHVWVFTYYERPTKRYPRGRTITMASNAMKVLAYEEELPYRDPKGQWRSGISYFHWWRTTGRFWSRSLMDVLRDPARMIDKRKTQINEIIDRGMPYVFVQEGSKASQRSGLPFEMIPIRADERAPIISNGTPPGPWLAQDVEALREDLEHGSGIRGPRLGENPTGVSTYSQLALISENEQTKRNPTRQDRQRAISKLVEDTVYDMRTYWGQQKQIMVAGDEKKVSAEIFDATKVPMWFLVTQAKGTPTPRNQAAKLQLITDIWNASVTSAQPLPIRWYKESLEAGQPLELPQQEIEDPADKAELENYMMTEQGIDMPIAYYDQHQMHLPIHRRAQDDALFSQDMQQWQLIEAHCQRHLQAEQEAQEALMQQQQIGQAVQQTAQQNATPQGAPAGAGPNTPKPSGA